MLSTTNEIDPTIAGGILAGAFLFLLMIELVLYIIMAAGLWKTATKAGELGLWAIIPIVQLFILAKIAGKPFWWAILLLVPLLNLVLIIIMMIEIAKRFGRGTGTALGLIFLPFIFFVILGFGSAQYNDN